MAWDSTRRYYYRSEWTSNGPRRVYVGGGLLGQLAADVDAQERAQRTAAADRRRLGRGQDQAANKLLDGQHGALYALVAALLTASGYYRHRRQWRRMDVKAFAKRYREAGEREATAAAGGAAHAGGSAHLTGPAGAPDPDAVERDLTALVQRVNAPHPTRADLDTLRAVLATDAGAGITVIGGDCILTAILDAYGAGPGAQLVMRADADRVARTLGRDTAPPFERPLIDHVVAAWVRLQLVERDHARSTAGSHSPESGAYWDRRLSEAQRRYLRAVNLLAKLRHLGPAQVQVNIGGQQVVVNGEK